MQASFAISASMIGEGTCYWQRFPVMKGSSARREYSPDRSKNIFIDRPALSRFSPSFQRDFMLASCREKESVRGVE